MDTFSDWVELEAAVKRKDDDLITKRKKSKNTEGGDTSCREGDDVGKESGQMKKSNEEGKTEK